MSHKKVFLIILILLTLVSCGNGVPASDDLVAKVKYRGQYGYIDTRGKWIIKPLYHMARSFSEGLAVVSVEGTGTLRDGVLYNAYYGYINKENDMTIETQFYTTAFGFREGYAVVEIDMAHYGFIDKKGNLIVDGFTELHPFSEGAAIALNKDEGIIGHIDTNGQWLTKFQYQEDVVQLGSFSNGLALIVKPEKNNRGETLSGYIDKNGKILIDCDYKKAFDFSEGLASVLKDGKYGFIDTKGSFIIKPQFVNSGSFSEGMAAVTYGKTFGFINKEGILLIDLKFENVNNFSEGLAAVLQNGKIGFINQQGELVIPPAFDNAKDFSQGYAAVVVDGKVGFIDKNGNWIIEPRYDSAQSFISIDETTDFSLF